MRQSIDISRWTWAPPFHWSLRVCAAAAFLALGIGHIAGLPKFVAVYEALGAGQWLRMLAGTAYLLGGGALAFRRAYRVGAALLGLLMGGVIFVDVTILDADPLPAVALGLACIAILWLHIDDRVDRQPRSRTIDRVSAK